MRLWSVHPKYLDLKGLVKLWHDALWAQMMLYEKLSKDEYIQPQLIRFKEFAHPKRAIHTYLMQIYEEAKRRGCDLDQSRIMALAGKKKVVMKVARLQLDYEFALMKEQVKLRDHAKYAEISLVKKAQAHPLFLITRGGIAEWEKVDSRTEAVLL